MNTEERQASWRQVYDRVLSYDSVEQSQAVAFLSLLQPQAMSDGFLMLTAETEFSRNWVERHYSDVIKQALFEIYQKPYTVIFEVNPDQTAEAQPAAQQTQTEQPSNPQPIAQQTQTIQPVESQPVVQQTQTENPVEVQSQQLVESAPLEATPEVASVASVSPVVPITPVSEITEVAVSSQEQPITNTQISPEPTNISVQSNDQDQIPQVQQVETIVETITTPTSTPVTTTVATPIATSTINITPEVAPITASATPAITPTETSTTHQNTSGQYEPVEAPVTKSYVMPTSSLTFESFVVGSSNQMAYSMALAVAENPGQTMLNPLFIYGRPGLGKTHLMRAIQNFIIFNRPDLTATYVDSADLLNQYVEATVAHDKEKSSFNNFKNNYQEADVLLIDDVQYLQGKTQTLDIIFQIFNHLIDQGKQVVLSADRAPKNIDMDERYQSRFNSGATFDIQPPEIETKLAIVKSFIDEYRSMSGGNSFNLPEDIMMHIAEISGSNIRELKSAVTKVIYTQNTLNKEQITKEDVSEILQNHFTGGATKQLQITDIQKAVEVYYGVSHSDLIGQKRVREIAYARQIAIYLARNMLGLPYQYIAQSFGGRDHSTIMHSVKQIEEKKKNNREVAEELENIIRRIKEA